MDAQAQYQYRHSELTYTDDGQLERFGDAYQYQYSGGKLIVKTVDEEEYTFEYNDNLPQDVSGMRTYDANGCLVKILNDDGSYIEYKYQKLELSEEDLQRHYTQQQSWLAPSDTSWIRIAFADPLCSVISVPTDPRLLVTPVTEYNK